MYLIPSHPSFLVLTFLLDDPFLCFSFFLRNLSFICCVILPFLSPPFLLFLANPVFPFCFFSPNLFSLFYYFSPSYLSLLFLFNDPFSFLFSFSAILSCALFPGSPILSCAAIASQPSFLPLLFLLINSFSISLPSHQSFLSILFVFLNAAAYLTPPTCPYLAAACRRLLSPSPA